MKRNWLRIPPRKPQRETNVTTNAYFIGGWMWLRMREILAAVSLPSLSNTYAATCIRRFSATNYHYSVLCACCAAESECRRLPCVTTLVHVIYIRQPEDYRYPGIHTKKKNTPRDVYIIYRLCYVVLLYFPWRTYTIFPVAVKRKSIL